MPLPGVRHAGSLCIVMPFLNAEMQYSKYFPSPPISFREKPMKSMTFLDHFKGNPDLCMQTQMKTDP